MAYPMGEAKLEPLRVDFDRRLKLEFHGSDISSDGGLLPYRELDHALGLPGHALDVATPGFQQVALPVEIVEPIVHRLDALQDVA